MGQVLGSRALVALAEGVGHDDDAAAAASRIQLVPATAKRVLHSFARLTHPGPNLVDNALLAKSGVACRVTDPFLRAADNAANSFLAFRVALMRAGFPLHSTWKPGCTVSSQRSRPRSSGDRARLS